MSGRLRIALVGDYNASVIAHRAIPEALTLSADITRNTVESIWVPTESISNPEANFRNFDAIWLVPGSPYANMEGALGAVRYARESGCGFLGTCGGFQHALIEYATNVCGLVGAKHAETDPDAAFQLISPLSCSLVERSGDIVLQDGSLLHRAYRELRTTEEYHCNYGLNREHETLLFRDGLRPTAHDLAGEVRAIELSGHPFFVATLFQHERRSLRGEAPPLVTAFIASVSRSSRGRETV